MATPTVLGKLLSRKRRAVTGVAFDLGVGADQRKFRFGRMIVGRRPPVLIVMAVLALRAEARGMRIVGLVAAVAILGNLVLVVAAAVTSQAVDLRVYAK